MGLESIIGAAGKGIEKAVDTVKNVADKIDISDIDKRIKPNIFPERPGGDKPFPNKPMDKPLINPEINEPVNIFPLDISDLIDIRIKGENSAIETGSSKEKIESTPMTDADREKLKAETGWSDEIINSIQTVEEANTLKNADVHEEEINGKKCLVRNDIDMNQIIGPDKKTNRKLMEEGHAPYAKNGNRIELHHIGQKKDSPLAELRSDEHTDRNIPNVNNETENPSRLPGWSAERAKHWVERSKN